MSQKLINRNPDLKRLQDEGFDVSIQHGFLILASIPYVTTGRTVEYGQLVSTLNLSGEIVGKPDTHQVWFTGEFPCDAHGRQLEGLRHSDDRREVCPGIHIKHHFSNKPPQGYSNYYEKMQRYAEIIANEARAIDKSVTARPSKPISDTESTSPFRYVDTASSRAGITNITLRCVAERIGIIGVGGTGSYVLDQIAKMPVSGIHLFDGDYLSSHNAFRSPGAASLDQLHARPKKVAYFARMYDAMHAHIFPHDMFISEETANLLDVCTFVFLCVDDAVVRKLISDLLIAKNIPFIDTGMDVQLITESSSLIGMCRVTMSTPEKRDHFKQHTSSEQSAQRGEYDSNIQIADLNALSACLAVIRWKKYRGIYQDHFEEHHTVYTLNTHHLSRNETKRADTNE